MSAGGAPRPARPAKGADQGPDDDPIGKMLPEVQTGQTVLGRVVFHGLVSRGRLEHRIDQLLTQLHHIFRRDFLHFRGVFHQQPP